MSGGAARWAALLLSGLVMLLAVALVVVVAGSAGREGDPVAAERIDVTAGGVPIRTAGSFGTPATAADALDPLRSSADGDRVVAAVFADLEQFWSAALSAAGRPALVPPAGGFVSMDSLGPAGTRALCINQPSQIAGNAFYCPSQDGIVFDSAGLVPVLLGSYGSAGLAAAFAHEFGHAVQVRVGPTPAVRQADPDRYPAILIEAQADCAAGAYLAGAVAAVDQPGTRVHIPPASLVRAVAPLLDFRDQPSVAPTAPTAHGLGLDRLGFVLHGYRQGPMSCWDLTTDDLSTDLALTLGRSGVLVDPPATPRYPSTDAAVAAAAALVAAFAGRPAADPDPTELDRTATIGQFAAGSAVAWATGRQLTGTDVGAACFTGAWSASVFGTAPIGELGSWAGDADEALDQLRSRPGVTFDELAAFADGFHGGRAACG